MIDVQALREKLSAHVQSEIKAWPCNSNRASLLGHECDLHLLFWRTRWQDAALHDQIRELLFRDGRIHEKATFRLLEDAGFEIIEQQRSFEWKEFQITGHTDGKLVLNGSSAPLEVKGYAAHTWQQLNSVEDFLNHRRYYVRRAPVQLNTYMWMDAKPEGLFVLKNKATGQIKFIHVELSTALGEVAVGQAERVNKHLAAGTRPDPITYDPEVCDDCAFKHLCLPDELRQPAEIGDTKLEEWLAEWAEVKAPAARYKLLDDKIKTLVRGKKEVLTTAYRITGKMIPRNYKAQEAHTIETWKTTINPLAKD